MDYAADANAVGRIALLLWPIVVVLLFAQLRPPLAASIAYVVAHLFLPERLSFDPPILAPLDKDLMNSLTVFVCCLVVDRNPRPVMARLSNALLAVLVLGCFATVLTNLDPLSYGATRIVGLSFSDAVATAQIKFFAICCPLIVGRRLFHTREDLVDLLKVLIVGALLYVPLILLEIRVSPQLNMWVYGFHQHDFSQTYRGGGWRPMVFVSHGLVLAKYLSETIALAFALRELKVRVRGWNAGVLGLILLVVLVLCSSLAALIYAAISVILITRFSPRARLRFGMFLIVLVTAYPLLRFVGNFPTAPLTALAGSYNDERGESLGYRFHMEDMLLKKALERPLFGWGGYMRSFVYDPATGLRVSIPDGTWIIELGNAGLTGTVALFAAYFLPMFVARRRALVTPDKDELALLSSIGIVLGFSWLDLLPNSGPSSHVLLLAGALHGVSLRAVSVTGSRAARLLQALKMLRVVQLARGPRGGALQDITRRPSG